MTKLSDSSLPHSIWATLLSSMIGPVTAGSLRVEYKGKHILSLQGPAPGPEAVVYIDRKRTILQAVLGGENGAIRAYIKGDWTSPDLVALCRFFACNPVAPGWPILAIPRRLLERMLHSFNANTRRGSRRNIAAHYDLSNDFFSLWLDDSMTYSSALWMAEDETLEQAQSNKLARVEQLLGTLFGKSVLEIGCGWGALATRLGKSGARVKGITLSAAQLALARKTIASQQLCETVSLTLEDYRDQHGHYDAIVSIEMAEAVGESNLPSYFATIRRNVKPGGIAVIQVITLAEDRMAGYRQQPDFIQRYIFPGGFLPSHSMLIAMAEQNGLRLKHQGNFGLSYARTLAEWRKRFDLAWPQIERLGFDEKFRRLWTYYLCYCEAGFLEHAIDLYLLQFVAAEESSQ